jgi:hypothetical protein
MKTLLYDLATKYTRHLASRSLHNRRTASQAPHLAALAEPQGG